jgi:hypothetical protein
MATRRNLWKSFGLPSVPAPEGVELISWEVANRHHYLWCQFKFFVGKRCYQSLKPKHFAIGQKWDASDLQMGLTHDS